MTAYARGILGDSTVPVKPAGSSPWLLATQLLDGDEGVMLAAVHSRAGLGGGGPCGLGLQVARPKRPRAALERTCLVDAAVSLASIAFQEACKKAKPVLLEPIMEVEVVTPEEFMGDVIGNLSSKRGKVKELSDRAGAKVIRAEAPLAGMFGYSTDLRSATQGRANYSMEFLKYDVVPSSIAEELIAKSKGTSSEVPA